MSLTTDVVNALQLQERNESLSHIIHLPPTETSPSPRESASNPPFPWPSRLKPPPNTPLLGSFLASSSVKKLQTQPQQSRHEAHVASCAHTRGAQRNQTEREAPHPIPIPNPIPIPIIHLILPQTSHNVQPPIHPSIHPSSNGSPHGLHHRARPKTQFHLYRYGRSTSLAYIKPAPPHPPLISLSLSSSFPSCRHALPHIIVRGHTATRRSRCPWTGRGPWVCVCMCLWGKAGQRRGG